jgi:O-acetyl-ADP-ribose deacetylase (regulator of RNase III)
MRNEILDEAVDAIAHSTNTHMSHEATFVRRAGRYVQMESSEHIETEGPLLVGQTWIGSCGSLPCGKVIHV